MPPDSGAPHREVEMPDLNRLDTLFVTTAYVIQIVLLAHFAMRVRMPETALRFGRVVYAVAVPALVVSILLLRGGRPWFEWLAGFLYTAWSTVGYTVDIARPVEWRSPIRWPIFLPYVLLYLASLMFYWWPLATIWRPLWYGYALLFVISSLLNIMSHRKRRVVG
jgi:hypothetical protein